MHDQKMKKRGDNCTEEERIFGERYNLRGTEQGEKNLESERRVIRAREKEQELRGKLKRCAWLRKRNS